METNLRQNKTRTVLKIFLPLACLLWLAFIFSNSLKSGEASAAQSSTVVNSIQSVAQVVAPDSWVANATGEDYEKLHGGVRITAHFLQFAVLGALLCWCYFAYTPRIAYIYLPISAVLLVPFIDECLQGFVAARAGELADILTDLTGGILGFLMAAFSVLIGVIIYKVKRKKRKQTPPMYGVK
jgi:VanZ family protein